MRPGLPPRRPPRRDGVGRPRRRPPLPGPRRRAGDRRRAAPADLADRRPDRCRTGGYEIEAAGDAGFDVRPGDRPARSRRPIRSACRRRAAALGSREQRWYRVRVRTAGGWTAWSEPLGVEAGLLDASRLERVGRSRSRTTRAVSGRRRRRSLRTRVRPRRDVRRGAPLRHLPRGPRDPAQRRAGEDAAPRARAGRPTDSACSPTRTTSRRSCAPAGTPSARMLGDGWYRGRVGWGRAGDRCRYGEDVALIAQLEVELADGRTIVVASDETLAGLDRGDPARRPLRRRAHRPAAAPAGLGPPGLRRRRLGARCRRAVRSRPDRAAVGRSRCEPSPPGRSTWCRRPTAASGSTPARTSRASCACASGASAATASSVRHAEVQEPRRLASHPRAARRPATDEYILDGSGDEVLEPAFTFHGFRYADVETDGRGPRGASSWPSAAICPPRSSFACSDPRLNRLHENVVWSAARTTSCRVPTDCPQRDERLGWTGDAQAFAATAGTLFDSAGLLAELAARPRAGPGRRARCPERSCPMSCSRAPAQVRPGGLGGRRDRSSRGPSTSRTATATSSSASSTACGAGCDSLEARQRPDGLLEPGMQFGDWLDPDAPPERPWLAKADSELPRQRLLRPQRAARWRAPPRSSATRPTERSGRRARRPGRRGRPGAWRDTPTHPDGLRGAICIRTSPRHRQRPAVGQALADWCDAADGRVATGFLGTPLVLPALAETGHIDEAYLMLLRHGRARRGCTRWSTARPRSGSAGTPSVPDGSIHPGHLTPGAGFARGNPRRRTCSRSTTTRTARSSTGSTATWRASPPTAGSPATASPGSPRRPSTGSRGHGRASPRRTGTSRSRGISTTPACSAARVGLPERHVRRVPAACHGGVGGDARRRPDRRYWRPSHQRGRALDHGVIARRAAHPRRQGRRPTSPEPGEPSHD